MRVKKLYDEKTIRDRVEQMMDRDPWCFQCGKSLYSVACGPTHAVLFHERVKNDKEQVRLSKLISK